MCMCVNWRAVFPSLGKYTSIILTMRSWSHAQQCFPLINFSLKVTEEKTRNNRSEVTDKLVPCSLIKKTSPGFVSFFACKCTYKCMYFKLFSELTRSSTRLIFLSGGPAWRPRLFRCTVHGNRSAILTNVSPHKGEKISLVLQVVFPSGMQPSPFFPWENVHDIRVTHT